MQGFTDQDIANKMDIARSTLKKWEKEIPEFSDALKIGKEPADIKVEQTLYQRAIGYSYTEKKVIITLNEDGTQKPSRIERTEKHVPPDTTAQIFWLKNRKPEGWREKKVVEIDNPWIELAESSVTDDE